MFSFPQTFTTPTFPSTNTPYIPQVVLYYCHTYFSISLYCYLFTTPPIPCMTSLQLPYIPVLPSLCSALISLYYCLLHLHCPILLSLYNTPISLYYYPLQHSHFPILLPPTARPFPCTTVPYFSISLSCIPFTTLPLPCNIILFFFCNLINFSMPRPCTKSVLLLHFMYHSHAHISLSYSAFSKVEP